MFTSNDPAAARLRRRLPLWFAALIACVAAGWVESGCGGRERAALHRDVRLEIAHDPPVSAPAGEPLLLGLAVTADPPLAPGSAHLWYDAGGGWVRSQLEPLAGTDRLEAHLPALPRGRTVRYYFTVRSPLGETMRLPRGGVRSPTEPAGRGGEAPRAPAASGAAESSAAPAGDGSPTHETRDVYELLIRAPVAGWAAWMRGGGAALALLLVLAGAGLSARWRPAEPPGRPAGVTLEALGVAVFALALVGAAIASFQATGNPLRDVAPGWWVAGAAWLPILALARALRRSPAGSARRARRLAVLAAILAVPGAVALLVGLAGLL